MSEVATPIQLTKETIDWRVVVDVARKGRPLSLGDDRWHRVKIARDTVDSIARSSVPHYGINTGLGALCSVVLDRDQLRQLSYHTLMSHACGVGEPLRTEQVRAIMCCAVINYSHGYSGISPAVVEGLLALLNHGITPVVPARGSVGYLTHMAHIGLALIGKGSVDHAGSRMSASDALSRHNLAPVTLGPKDGLSLVNGTPAMTGLACIALDDAYRLADWADIIGASSFEALAGQLDAFSQEVLQLKRQSGVTCSGNNLRRLISGSERLRQCQGDHLQDALSIRAMPQVHGACREQLWHATRQIAAELNSATDNPLVVATPAGSRIVSQANPHGASVAMACDSLAIAVCEWASIAERRCYRLVTPEANQLPAFLTEGSGVKSGMMIAQYTAAALAADAKRLAHPASIDNFMTSGLQEDHLSLGDSAALKLDQVLETAHRLLGIELLLATQALDLLPTQGFGQGTEQARTMLRDHVAYYDEEHALHHDMETAFQLITAPNSLVPFEPLLAPWPASNTLV